MGPGGTGHILTMQIHAHPLHIKQLIFRHYSISLDLLLIMVLLFRGIPFYKFP